jgi:hypothetical protein
MANTGSRRELSTTVACTLTGLDLGSQRARWIALGARAGTGRIEIEEGLRLVFADEPGVEDELRALTAVENECCSWATWTVSRSGTSLFMDARSHGDGVAALHGMFVDAVKPASDCC